MVIELKDDFERDRQIFRSQLMAKDELVRQMKNEYLSHVQEIKEDTEELHDLFEKELGVKDVLLE